MLKCTLEEIRKTGGEIIASLRKAEEVQQKDLARELFINPMDLCNYEKGRRNKSLLFFITALNILGYKATVYITKAAGGKEEE